MDLEPGYVHYGSRSEYERGREKDIHTTLKNNCITDWEDWVFDRMIKYVDAFGSATNIIENNVKNITRQIRIMEDFNDKALEEKFDNIANRV